MTAWGLLVQHSTLASGTAWDHLNAQAGGIIVNDGIAVTVDTDLYSLEVQASEVVAYVQEGIVIELDSSPLSIEAQIDAPAFELIVSDLETTT